jgi:hypothetical protein
MLTAVTSLRADPARAVETPSRRGGPTTSGALMVPKGKPIEDGRKRIDLMNMYEGSENGHKPPDALSSRDSPWECASVHLYRKTPGAPWQARVRADEGEEEATLTGLNLVLSYYGAYGWELVSVIPDLVQPAGLASFTQVALPFNTRPYRIERAMRAAGVTRSTLKQGAEPDAALGTEPWKASDLGG